MPRLAATARETSPCQRRLYGVMAYGVARRRGDIGVRIALGASGASVLRMVLRETIVLATLGIVLGVLAALATTRLLQSLLFGLCLPIPRRFAAMVAAMIAVGLLAGSIPARRAARGTP